MIPYYSMFFMLAFFALVSHVKEFRRIRLFYYLLVTIILILFAELRQVGSTSDMGNYYSPVSFGYLQSVCKIEHLYNLI